MSSFLKKPIIHSAVTGECNTGFLAKNPVRSITLKRNNVLMENEMKKTLLILAVLLLISCGEDNNSKNDEDAAIDDGSNDENVLDQDQSDEDTEYTDDSQDNEITDETDDSVSDEINDDVSDETNDSDSEIPVGFEVRKPQERTVSCDGEELTLMDMDWICTFDHNGKSGFVYIQSNMTSCEVIMSASPVFTSAGSWISIDGEISETTAANYDWGGNHHNDFLEFTYSGTKYKYYHSSFGYGWRSCQNMDCIQVGDPVTEDGCTKERTLPAVCQQVQADGTVGSFKDLFEPCAGDPNYEG